MRGPAVRPTLEEVAARTVPRCRPDLLGRHGHLDEVAVLAPMQRNRADHGLAVDVEDERTRGGADPEEGLGGEAGLEVLGVAEQDGGGVRGKPPWERQSVHFQKLRPEPGLGCARACTGVRRV